ncbi:DNA-3-methyladenine glycosylase [uncultured Secundilactobacillus sp.]|uniref:DNA-3-methyladenine glycosylase n=1 Tax=uncultured Secundilactobacillus sp. TaxID=2813935 RepID=UPI0025883E87|nr:DNA-3-methyladenine glycosylase [uncultured Secundilactobacillus sp.]
MVIKTDFFESAPTAQLAQKLLGVVLTVTTKVGPLRAVIVETEAYVGQLDAADHGYGGRITRKNRALFAAPGTVFTYQMHRQTLLNFVTQAVGDPQGILIRAVQPIEGLSAMTQNRPKTGPALTNDPGKLTQALGLTMALNGRLLPETPLTLSWDPIFQPREVQTAPRIGIANKGSWTAAPLRFLVAGNPFVSKQLKRDMDLDHYGWRSNN